MTAFKNLPPWSDFEKGRDSDMLRMRSAYIRELWECHRETLRRHSDMATSAAEEAAHDEWVPAVHIEDYVSAAQLLSMSMTSLRYSSIFGVAEVGRRL